MSTEYFVHRLFNFNGDVSLVGNASNVVVVDWQHFVFGSCG